MAADTTAEALAGETKDALIRGRLLRSVASNVIGKAVTIGTWVVLTPFILGHLGATTYGIWVLVGSIVAYGGLLDFGIGGAVIKYVAEYQARGALAESRALVATALWLYAGLGGLALLLSVVLAPLFPWLFQIPPGERPLAMQLVMLMGLTLGISLPCATAPAVLRGLQRYDLVNLLTTLGTVTSALATILVLALGGGVIGMVAVNIPITIVLQLLAIRLIARVAPALRFGWRAAERRLARQVIGYSSSVFLLQAASQLQTKTDEIVIGALLPVSAITPYALARRLSEAPQIITDQFIKVLLPLASELHTTDDRQRLRALYVISTRLTLAISLAIACGLIFLARAVLTLWVGVAYADAARLVVLLTIASLIATSQWPAGNILQGMARHRAIAFAALGSGVANLALSIALAPALGLTGIALGTLIPTAIESFGFVLPYSLRAVGVSPREVLREIGLPALLPAIPAGLLVWGLREAFDASGLLAVIVIAGAGALIYLAGYLAFPVTGAERRVCWSLVTKVAARIGALRQRQ